jgi:hypothetical protein
MKTIEELQLNDDVWCADIRSNRLHKLCQTTISEFKDVKKLYSGIQSRLKIALSDKVEFIVFKDRHYDNNTVLVSTNSYGNNWFVIGTVKEDLKNWLTGYFDNCIIDLKKKEAELVDELVHIKNKQEEVNRSFKRLEKF